MKSSEIFTKTQELYSKTQRFYTNNTEIRIGNYIKRKGLVVQVDEQTFWDIKNNPDEYEPILINRDWLLRFKLSFQNNGRVAFCFDDEIKIEEIEGVFYFHFHFLKKEIKYIHQLQNLYHAITLQELQII